MEVNARREGIRCVCGINMLIFGIISIITVNFNTMWRSSKLIYSFARRANPVTYVPPPVPSVVLPQTNLLLTSLNTYQLHNMVEYMTSSQLAETSISDKITKGLLSLLSQNLPLINLSQQCSTIKTRQNTVIVPWSIISSKTNHFGCRIYLKYKLYAWMPEKASMNIKLAV